MPIIKATDHPLDWLEKLLEVMGVVSASPDKRPLYFRPVAVLMQVLHVYAMTFSFLYVIGDHPFSDKMESTECFLSLIHMSAKYINLHYNTGPYRKIVDASKQLWGEVKLLPETRGLLDDMCGKMERDLKFFMGLYCSYVSTSCLVALVTNMYLEPEEQVTLYQVWSPFPEWYWTEIFVEGSCITLTVAVLAVDILAMYGHCRLAAAILQVLQTRLEADRPDLKSCAQLHSKVLRYIQDINEYFSGQMFLGALLASLLSAPRAYITLVLLNMGDPRVVAALYFFVICFAEPLLVCFCGQTITDNSEKFFTSTYNNTWYNSPSKEKRSLLIIRCQASKIKTLNYRHILDFNMNRFALVIQSVYSYMTLLRGLDA